MLGTSCGAEEAIGLKAYTCHARFPSLIAVPKFGTLAPLGGLASSADADARADRSFGTGVSTVHGLAGALGTRVDGSDSRWPGDELQAARGEDPRWQVEGAIRAALLTQVEGPMRRPDAQTETAEGTGGFG